MKKKWKCFKKNTYNDYYLAHGSGELEPHIHYHFEHPKLIHDLNFEIKRDL